MQKNLENAYDYHAILILGHIGIYSAYPVNIQTKVTVVLLIILRENV